MVEIRPLQASPEVCAALADLLVEAVAGGASVSFMHPLTPEAAGAFWARSLAAAALGERIVLAAFDGDTLAGTVTLLLDCPPNQPHRAEIAKMITRASHRGRGIASALMAEAERLAVERARTLLVLDTASEGGASGFYEGLGFVFAGEIPGYALSPRGGLNGARFYFKPIGPEARG